MHLYMLSSNNSDSNANAPDTPAIIFILTSENNRVRKDYYKSKIIPSTNLPINDVPSVLVEGQYSPWNPHSGESLGGPLPLGHIIFVSVLSENTCWPAVDSLP